MPMQALVPQRIQLEPQIVLRLMRKERNLNEKRFSALKNEYASIKSNEGKLRASRRIKEQIGDLNEQAKRLEDMLSEIS
ncbi:MAG: hypothetical protein ACKOAD_08055 [Gammaproteobacteria bacterium]